MWAAGPPRLEVTDHYGRTLPEGFLRRVVTATLEFAGAPGLHVSLLLTNEHEIASVHDRFMGDSSGTDVISFPMDDGVDLVVSVERAECESAARGHAVEAEIALYVIHGILHVCGFDDTTDEARETMRRAERDVLRSLGLQVAPVDE